MVYVRSAGSGASRFVCVHLSYCGIKSIVNIVA